jgi:methionyl-tRNA formyltransferase
MKLIFFGSSQHVLPAIEMLNSDFKLVLVVTTEKDAQDAVPAYCRDNNIPFLSVRNLRDPEILERIKTEDAVVGVLGYFGLILPLEILAIFPKGIINIHPSLLPKYRGPTPVQTAILNGDKETGTSIILLDNEVDHGPILVQQINEIRPEDTTESLHSRLFTLGAELIKKVLPQYLNDQISLSKQDHSKATFTKHLNKIDGQIDIDRLPDRDKLDRMIRAYYPWPTVWTMVRIKNKELRIKLLPEGKIQVEGGKPMSKKDFLNGYPGIEERLKDLITR